VSYAQTRSSRVEATREDTKILCIHVDSRSSRFGFLRRDLGPTAGVDKGHGRSGVSCAKSHMRSIFLAGAVVILVLGVGLSGQAAATSPSGEILFSSNRSGSWRLWTIRADGSDLKQLTKQDSDDQDVDPMFSPDGKMILFTSTRGGPVGVWKMAADGNKPERICDGDQAEWAPSAKLIALRRKERILTRNLDTGTETTLTPADWPHCSGPAWSPDGKSVAFAARWDAGNGIYIVPAQGGTPVKIYDQQGACEPH